MKFFRPIVFALFAFCANGGVWAADEAAQLVQVAQSQDGAQSGDNRPATLGDIRHMENRMDAKISELRVETRELRAQNQAFHATLHNALLAIIGIFATMAAALIALLWKSRYGNPSASSVPLVALLVMAGLGVALTASAVIASVV